MGSPFPILVLTLALLYTLGQFSCAQNSPQDFLVPHNNARRAVGVGPLRWNNSLVAYARNRVRNCQLVPTRNPYGENVFHGGPGTTAAVTVNTWVAERRFYNHTSNTCVRGHVCRHYTQVVWRRTLSVGCAVIPCTRAIPRVVYVVCEYWPRGNIPGQRPY